MEMAILLFLLAMSGGDSSQLKEKLSSALAFYRENRELIAMLASGGGLFGGAPAAQSAQTPQENQPAAGQTEENPNIKILEEFLKARTV